MDKVSITFEKLQDVCFYGEKLQNGSRCWRHNRKFKKCTKNVCPIWKECAWDMPVSKATNKKILITLNNFIELSGCTITVTADSAKQIKTLIEMVKNKKLKKVMEHLIVLGVDRNLARNFYYYVKEQIENA
jgi:hypothetical protein